MGMKFLNKKGWHTGSLRNIENVWKAEQKNDAELKKLEELRKQILEEREKSEFRLLQEQAGLVPKQERLDFLYDSGLAVGKGSSDGFKELQSLPKKPEKPEPEIASASGSASANVSAAPGALFEDKPQSANDSWRKLHSDPLLMIRQREQEALARVRNNPVQMAMIHKSIGEKKPKKKGEKKKSKKHRDKSSKHKRHSSPSDSENGVLDRKRNRKGSDDNRPESNYRNSSPSDSENDALERKRNRKARDHNRPESDEHSKRKYDSEDDCADRSLRKKNHDDNGSRYKDVRSHDYRKRDTSRSEVHYKPQDSERAKHDRYSSFDDQIRLKADDHFSKPRRDSEEEFVKGEGQRKKDHDDIAESDTVKSDSQHRPRDSERSKYDRYSNDGRKNPTSSSRYRVGSSSDAARYDAQNSRKSVIQKISEEERAARLEAMQKDAELHEEQRWKRIKKADEEDAREAALKSTSTDKNFLDAAKTSVYGAAEKGNFTIEESVRRRAHYLQGRSEANAGSAFRR